MVIVDDHILFKELITDVVNGIPGLAVAGWAKTEAEAMQLCARIRPRVVILDLLLVPSSSGIVALHRIRSVCPEAHILIFSGNLSPAVVQRVLAAGEFSLIGKTATLEEFRAALRTVASGKVYFSPEIADTIRSLISTGTDRSKPGISRLTLREESVLRFLARGMSSREIGAALGLSRHTVANHRSRLMRKIGVRGTAQLSLYAASLGLVDRATPPRRPNPGLRRAS